MILTAKHCLIDKKIEEFSVFFGDDTNKLDHGLIREVKAMEVRRPVDWEMTFPSFDVAWIELKEEAPENFKPLPILSTKEELLPLPIHLAGHGNSSPTNGSIEAGKKFITTTNLKTYYDNARFFHILLFEGQEGQGACHGDSGGPAYIKTDSGWAIIGVTNGFDLVLTPKAMTRTSDEDFPYRIDCKKNQMLYSFAGAHGAWIERTSNKKILKTREFIKNESKNKVNLESIESWCNSKDFGSPHWNFLKLILDKKVDSMDQDLAADFYNDCSEIEHHLLSLKELRIDGSKTMDASYSLAPLQLLDLESLKIFNSKIDQYSFHSEKMIKLKRLALSEVGLKDLAPLSLGNLNLDFLDLGNNPLSSLKGLSQLSSLKGISLYRTDINDFTPLLNFPDLEELDLSQTHLKSAEFIRAFKLKRLVIGSESLEELHFQGQDKLEVLFVTSTELFDASLLSATPNLKEANLPHLKIDDLSVFSNFSFPHLERLNLTGNPVENLKPLSGLKNLVHLKVFGTPLARKEVTKTPENCPTTGPEVLVKFCSIP